MLNLDSIRNSCSYFGAVKKFLCPNNWISFLHHINTLYGNIMKSLYSCVETIAQHQNRKLSSIYSGSWGRGNYPLKAKLSKFSIVSIRVLVLPIPNKIPERFAKFRHKGVFATTPWATVLSRYRVHVFLF